MYFVARPTLTTDQISETKRNIQQVRRDVDELTFKVDELCSTMSEMREKINVLESSQIDIIPVKRLYSQSDIFVDIEELIIITIDDIQKYFEGG